jgi:hypothetical protein
LCPAKTLPAFNVTPPVKVFAPLNVKVAELLFTILPPAPLNTPPIVSAPAPLSVTRLPCKSTAPLNVTALATLTVAEAVTVPAPDNVKAPLLTESPSVDVPAPTAYAFVSVRTVVESLETVPPANVNTPAPKAAAFPTRTIPPLIVAPPVNVFAPVNVKIPVPLFTSDPPAPLITPE